MFDKAETGVLVFGGSFNPPTLAHEAIIAACLALPGYGQVWLLPSGERSDKTYPVDDAGRLAMLQLVRSAHFANDPRLVVSDVELRLPRPTQTARTVAALQQAYPDKNFTFVFGSDAYQDMPHWQDGRRLQQQLPMLLVERPGAPLPAGAATLQVNTQYADHSSTAVRQALAAHHDPAPLVSQPVLAYINERKLYG